MSQHFELSDAPITWVMAGDSITQGVLHTYGARSWVEHFHERIRWQMDRFFDVVINSGMSGWTAPQVLEHYQHLIGRYTPHALHIALGTNDARQGEAGLPSFCDAMTELIQRNQPQTRVILHTPVPVTTTGKGNRAFLSSYCQTIRELAQTYDTFLIDHEDYWLKHFGDYDPIAWMDDSIHPNAVGHAQMAQLTIQSLGLGALEKVKDLVT